VKLRIRGNSIRLRLRQGEVRQLADEGLVEERTEFGRGQMFLYAIRADDVPTLHASFDGTRITVRVPRDLARRWASSEQVGIEATPDADEPLQILIEKDFECIDAPADESQEDAFPNPRAAAACTPPQRRP
jgi:hypothetical protein